MTKMTFLISFSVLVLACCKEPTPTKPPASTKQFEVLWKTLIVPDNSGLSSISMNPILHDDELVVNSEYAIDGVNAPVLFLDTADGSIKRKFTGLSGGPYDGFQVTHSNNYLFFNLTDDIDCINMNTASLEWHDNVAATWPSTYANNGYLYRGFPYNYENNYNKSCRLKRTPLGSNAWETVYDFTKTDNYRPGFLGCGFGFLPNGDEILVWENWSLTPGNSERTDIFAYNLTADILMWRNTDFKESATVVPLKVVDGVVYGLLHKSAIAIDLTTGTTLWQQIFTGIDGFHYKSDFHVYSSYVVVKEPNNNLYYLRKNNGTIWKTLPAPSIYDKYTYFEGKLWGAGDGISAIDLATGVDLLKGYQQIHDDRWYSSITIDPLRRVMYCHDGVYAYCIKIPDL